MPRSSARNFKQGRAGEKYVHNHINQLLAHGIVTYNEDTARDFVEGGDNRIIYNKFGDEVSLEEYLFDGVANTGSTGHAITRQLRGGLEVKTISGFLFRNNDMDEPSGTLPFALWNERRVKHGWLLALIYPEIRLNPEEEQPVHAAQPVLFCFLLVSYLGPFACIMFEDFSALADRLKQLAVEKGFQLDPEHIPVGEEAVSWREDDPYIIGNMWHIPFDKIQDLATVTMIGDMPLIKCSIQLGQRVPTAYEVLQQTRYDYLSQCAGDRTLSAEIQSERDFYPADENRIYADILNNMEIITNLQEEDYPFLCKALKNRYMRAHLNCILLNMYSHPEPTKVGRMIGFLQAKKYLQDWGKLYSIPGSTFSWQAHIIFLTDAGLIKKFVDTQRPSNQQVYRSAPRYTARI